MTYIRMLPETLAANLREGLVDGAILQRDAVPATMVSELLSAFQAAKVPYLLDLDDHLLSVPPDKDPAGRYAAYVPFLRSLIESADILTVSTEPLRDALLTLNKNTCVVQNRLSAALWRGQLPERVHDDFVRAVYIGTPTHGRDLALVSPALAAVHAADPKFRLAIIGITEGELPTWADRIVIPGEARSYAHFVPWLRAHSAFFDFAIAPLENNEFNRYKSPLKILDAGALGLPVIASNSPVFSNFAHVRGVQLVPDSPDAWTKALHQRIDRKRDDGAALRRFVFENYVLEPSLPDYDRMVLTMLEHKN